MARTIAGRTVIITGASSGIGRATALALARERAKLVLVARREQLLAELEAGVRAAGGEATSLVLDLTERRAVETMIRSSHQRFGRIDVLINNAGFGYYGSVENTPESLVREMFDLNFNAALYASQLAIPIMRAKGGGHIINVSSIAGKRGLPFSGIYSATKFALNGISEALRIELEGSGIEVSVVNPGATKTEFVDKVRTGDVTKKFTPMGHVQSAEAVAADIVHCIQQPKAEVYPYRAGRLLAWINAIAPSFVDIVVRRVYRERLAARSPVQT
jgi:short-subunit dehydrogenase